MHPHCGPGLRALAHGLPALRAGGDRPVSADASDAPGPGGPDRPRHQHAVHEPADQRDQQQLRPQVRADEKNILLEVKHAGVIPDVIYTDPTRLRQILINLVGNAIKFTDFGTVRIVGQVVGAQSANPLFQIQVATKIKKMMSSRPMIRL